MKMLSFLPLLVVAVCSAAIPVRAESLPVEQLQAVIDNFVATRADIEKISGAALHVDIGGGNRIEVYAGTYGRDPHPIDERTLFQIGSNTKHYTAALILKLEAEGLLNIDQTVGDWLPDYHDWSGVTIRSLLNMTSGIPNYSETVPIAETISAYMHHQFSFADLIAAAYDTSLPKPQTVYFYSNTNSIIAAKIIEAAAHMSYKEALRRMLAPLHVRDTFYEDRPYSVSVLRRLPQGFYENTDCTLYQAVPCSQTAWAGLVGQDVRTMNMSWAGPAGGMISNTTDLARWVRALFSGRVIPEKQLHEMMTIVSVSTGQPIGDVTAEDPAGFGLDIGRSYRPELGGKYWFYQGTTFGYRAVFAYWPQYDLIVTTMTNSQPEDADDQFAAQVVGGTFKALQDSGVLGAQ